MSEKPQNIRKQRTEFTPLQLEVLRDNFHKTHSPNPNIIQDLASSLCLSDTVVKNWFKNQRMKWKKGQRRSPSLSPGTSPQTPSAAATANFAPLPTGSSDHRNSHGRTTSTVCGSSRNCEPCDILEIHLSDLNPFWASLPDDLDQLIKLYFLPGDDDPSSLDIYLVPGCLH